MAIRSEGDRSGCVISSRRSEALEKISISDILRSDGHSEMQQVRIDAWAVRGTAKTHTHKHTHTHTHTRARAQNAAIGSMRAARVYG